MLASRRRWCMHLVGCALQRGARWPSARAGSWHIAHTAAPLLRTCQLALPGHAAGGGGGCSLSRALICGGGSGCPGVPAALPPQTRRRARLPATDRVRARATGSPRHGGGGGPTLLPGGCALGWGKAGRAGPGGWPALQGCRLWGGIGALPVRPCEVGRCGEQHHIPSNAMDLGWRAAIEARTGHHACPGCPASSLQTDLMAASLHPTPPHLALHVRVQSGARRARQLTTPWCWTAPPSTSWRWTRRRRPQRAGSVVSRWQSAWR